VRLGVLRQERGRTLERIERILALGPERKPQHLPQESRARITGKELAYGALELRVSIRVQLRSEGCELGRRRLGSRADVTE
jgi:hypothetical protein